MENYKNIKVCKLLEKWSYLGKSKDPYFKRKVKKLKEVYDV